MATADCSITLSPVTIKSQSAACAQASFLVRSELMQSVRETIVKNGWTQQETAKLLGIHQPRVSDLFQGRMSKFSVETLMDWLDGLGKKVVVTVQDKDVA
jgi:predicted XRE-type DNA-binding protein